MDFDEIKTKGSVIKFPFHQYKLSICIFYSFKIINKKETFNFVILFDLN